MRTTCMAVLLALQCAAQVSGSYSVALADKNVISEHMPTSAAAFIDSVGVVTHFGYTDTLYYKQSSQVISIMQAAGLRHIRDGVLWGTIPANLFGIQSRLAAAGIGATLVCPNPSTATTFEALTAAIALQPEVEAIEAPNEWDQAGGKTWAATLLAYLPTLRRVARAAKVPLYGPSLTKVESYAALGDIRSLIDVNSEHNYWGGRNPETRGWGGVNAQGHSYGSAEFDLDLSAVNGPGMPVAQTETGYIANNTVAPHIPAEDTVAIYMPRLLLHSWNNGITRSFIYELIDEPSSTTGYGLLRADMTPRPAFIAVSSLLNLLTDRRNSRPLFPLPYLLTTSSSLESTLLQKNDGSYWLALWNPNSIWDVDAVKSTPVAPIVVKLTLGGRHIVKTAYQFDSSGFVSTLHKSGSSVILSVSSAITLVKIS